MNSKNLLHAVPVPSTSFVSEACWDETGMSPAIRFTYKRNEAEYRSGIAFDRVLAFRRRAERCCKAWHIEGAYDTLVEILDSSWVEEMRADTDEQWRAKWGMNHYMIYLDSVGCFEVIAESWSVLPDKIVEPGSV